MEVFVPLKPRNPSRQLAARLGERKTPGKRRMRLGVRLSQLAVLTDRIPAALPWDNPLLPAQTAHTAQTARTRRWGREQIRAELLSQHKTLCQHIRGAGIPRGWSCSCSSQPLRTEVWPRHGPGSERSEQPPTAPPRGDRGTFLPESALLQGIRARSHPNLAGSSCTPRHRVPAVTGGSRWL